MASYGRNFDFRILPESENRRGRFAVPSVGNAIPIGVPVGMTNAAETSVLGLSPVDLVTGATAPLIGHHGIVVFEYGPAAFAGNDPYLTTYSDKDTIPLGAAVQVVSGPDIKVVFRNTFARTFHGTRQYAGRLMVAGIGIATPTIAVGDLLTPGTGTDVAGYWAETGSASNAWLRVTHVDNARAEVEAQLLF